MVCTDEIRVLLVNDDPGSRFALQTILTDLDAMIETAASGEEALALLLKRDVAVIILDVKMPGIDGFETARLIRQRPRTKYTPIIFLTSHRATDLDRATGYELGRAWVPGNTATPRHSGSLGLMGETPFGVVFFGGAFGDQGDRKLFFRLGRVF